MRRSRAQEVQDAAPFELLLRQVESLYAGILDAEERLAGRLKRTHPLQLESARNLIHYIALRRHDLRSLQDGLASVGLSSLGRAEAHVLATVGSVRDILARLTGGPVAPKEASTHLSYEEGRSRLKTHTEQLLGRKPAPRFVRIMATLSQEAATQPKLLTDLLMAGTDCVRINCAHDRSEDWVHMVENLRRAESAVGRNCRVLFDLGGPKIRTGPIEPAESVIRLRPDRDRFGRVTAAGAACLVAAEAPVNPVDGAVPLLPVPARWLARLRVGDVISFRDARGKKRKLNVIRAGKDSLSVETTQTAFLQAGTRLRVERGSKSSDDSVEKVSPARLQALPPTEQPILVRKGDLLILNRSRTLGRLAHLRADGSVRRPARVGCTAPEIFADVKPGERIWFDDGKIGGVIESATKNRLVVRITTARAKGEKLWADKGINLPDSRLRLPALTAKDLQDLKCVTEQADLVGYSFVQTAADVRALQGALRKAGGSRVGMVLKIETRQAFEQLPDLLLAAMQSPLVGVMIARGDLAVECGYERLAELQEEILWICEAAHVPVIWATQVLECLARDGVPSRAEVTDAAMGVRAECVMLNKGPEQVAAVRTLDRILHLMESHQNKKTSMMRSLALARAFAVRDGSEEVAPRARGDS